MTEISNKELRNFGYTLATIIAVLFGLLFPTIFNWKYLNISWLLVIYFTLSALLIPKTLKPTFKVWSLIGQFLNWINTKVILGFIFIFMFIPIAIFFRIIARDLLHKKFDPDADSYREIPSTNRAKLDLTKPY